MTTPADTRRYWLPQLIVILAIAILGTLPFWFSDLDLRVAGLFYHPDADDPWHESTHALWMLLYQAAPVLAGLGAVGAFIALMVSHNNPARRPLRLYGFLFLGTLFLGPGLLVNLISKDYTGRPRPHQTEELGGTKPYLPPLVRGESGAGKSFPCGHSSIGYVFAVFFLIWQRRRPWLAVLSLVGALALGSVIGVARMVAGDHFLSDVIWSAVLTFIPAWLLYYFVLGIPQREDAMARDPAPEPGAAKGSKLATAGYATLAVVTLAGVLLATPVHETRMLKVDTGRFTPEPRKLIVDADSATLILFWIRSDQPAVLLSLRGRGFGLPTSHISADLQANADTLTYRLEHKGVFTEKDSTVYVGVAISRWDSVLVRTGEGDIAVRPPPETAPTFRVVTDDGEILGPANNLEAPGDSGGSAGD